MTETALESLLRRDRAVVWTALAVLTLLAWSYILWLASAVNMGTAPSNGMPAMPGMEMSGTAGIGGAMAPMLTSWSVSDALFMMAMWTVMMAGMMTPSATPMILIYARVGRQAAAEGKPFVATAWFASGYLVAWTGFAFLATAAQWALERLALLTPMLASASSVFGGLVLIAAGLYQWTPLKDACLSQCQTPFAFIQRNGGFRREPRGALTLGLRHGAYCIGCCWALMALLFVGGVMNLLWVAAIASLVLAEKALPPWAMLQRISGAALLAAGAWMLASAA